MEETNDSSSACLQGSRIYSPITIVKLLIEVPVFKKAVSSQNLMEVIYGMSGVHHEEDGVSEHSIATMVYNEEIHVIRVSRNDTNIVKYRRWDQFEAMETQQTTDDPEEIDDLGLSDEEHAILGRDGSSEGSRSHNHNHTTPLKHLLHDDGYQQGSQVCQVGHQYVAAGVAPDVEEGGGETHRAGDDLRHHGGPVVVCGQLDGRNSDNDQQLLHQLSLLMSQASPPKKRFRLPFTINVLRTASLTVPAISSVQMMTTSTRFLIRRKASWEQSDWLLKPQIVEQDEAAQPEGEAGDEHNLHHQLEDQAQVHSHRHVHQQKGQKCGAAHDGLQGQHHGRRSPTQHCDTVHMAHVGGGQDAQERHARLHVVSPSNL